MKNGTQNYNSTLWGFDDGV